MYETIEENTSNEILEKKSKFIANLFYVENKQEAENIIKEIKKKHHAARHNCYAYRVLEDKTIFEKESDDRRTFRNCRSTNFKFVTKK